MADVVGVSVVVVVVVVEEVEDGMVVEVASDVVVVLVVNVVVVEVVVLAGFFFLGISHRESHWLTNTHLSPGSHSAVPVLSRSKQKREDDNLSSPDRSQARRRHERGSSLVHPLPPHFWFFLRGPEGVVVVERVVVNGGWYQVTGGVE